MTDPETVALRVTVIGGKRYADNFTVICAACESCWQAGTPHIPFGIGQLQRPPAGSGV